ncbi:NDR1/HIN1-like protein 2 [Abrus precatorius]|uniref:NDR1/HIN1-like protein 2 n=1 Tax=Abrus precatorius TaxID=3816 RepID=A0A8B8KXZ4_ABRPR|nr:NDR1/HIN1-like protein 2 [Abrus precatorius]
MDHATGNNLPSPIITPPEKSISDDIHRIIIIVASVFVILGAIIGVAWFILRPHEPNFVVDSLSLSNFSVSEAQLKGNSNILTITIRNTNRNEHLVIDPFQVYVYYHDKQLSVATMATPINIRSMSMIWIKAELGMGKFSNSMVIGNPQNLDENGSSLKLWTIVSGDFVVKMWVRAKVKGLFEMLKWRMSLDVSCGVTDMRLAVTNDIWNVLGVGLCDVFQEH